MQSWLGSLCTSERRALGDGASTLPLKSTVNKTQGTSDSTKWWLVTANCFKTSLPFTNMSYWPNTSSANLGICAYACTYENSMIKPLAKKTVHRWQLSCSQHQSVFFLKFRLSWQICLIFLPNYEKGHPSSYYPWSWLFNFSDLASHPHCPKLAHSCIVHYWGI